MNLMRNRERSRRAFKRSSKNEKQKSKEHLEKALKKPHTPKKINIVDLDECYLGFSETDFHQKDEQLHESNVSSISGEFEFGNNISSCSGREENTVFGVSAEKQTTVASTSKTLESGSSSKQGATTVDTKPATSKIQAGTVASRTAIIAKESTKQAFFLLPASYKQQQTQILDFSGCCGCFPTLKKERPASSETSMPNQLRSLTEMNETEQQERTKNFTSDDELFSIETGGNFTLKSKVKLLFIRAKYTKKRVQTQNYMICSFVFKFVLIIQRITNKRMLPSFSFIVKRLYGVLV